MKEKFQKKQEQKTIQRKNKISNYLMTKKKKYKNTINKK